MMKDAEYSEKETAIFEGLINLIKEWFQSLPIKAFDIAMVHQMWEKERRHCLDRERLASRAIIYGL